MTTYGSIPGVRITTSTGTVSGVTIGRTQYLLLVGVGDDTNASVAPNEPVSIQSNTDVDNKFGEGSDIANAYRRVITNGANPNYIMGVRTELTSQGAESFTSSTGTLAEGPVVADETRITATDTTASSDLDVVFDYQSPPSAPDNGEFRLNPYTREFETTASEVDVEYATADWASAMDTYKQELVEGEFAVLSPLTSNPDVAISMQNTISTMRSNMKMVLGIQGVEYNANGDSDGTELDASDYTSTFDDDTLWLVGPTKIDGGNDADRDIGALSAVSGLFAGNDTTEPVYDTTIQGVGGLAQRITSSDVTDLRNQSIVPLRDTGTIRVRDNRSTYDQDTNGGWERDFFRRRVVDLTMVTIYFIARRQIGSILDSGTVEDVQDAVNVELSDLVEDGLLEPDAQSVNVYRADDRTIGLDLTITPLGVTKGADIDLEVNA